MKNVISFFTFSLFMFALILSNGCGKAESKELEEKEKSEQKIRDPIFYEVSDIIVNPAETMGKRFAITSIAFELKDEKDLEKIKQYDVKLKDIINSTIAQKTIEELTRIGYKDVIKTEIFQTIKKNCKDLQVTNVYITKYVIQ